MSDTESQSTIEDVPFSKILEILSTAADDSVSSKDYLSYSTVLDIYIGQPTRFSYEEREELLQRLLEIFEENREIVYEVGWDLPQLLLQYVDLDFDFEGPIRKAPSVYRILKLFEHLAVCGNHKELLLKSCEVLSNLKVLDLSVVTSSVSIQEKFFDLKLYCIIELIDSCLRQIKTLYPSRFLSMPITAFCNMIYLNKPNNSTHVRFIAKRVYNFARNYSPSPLPPPTVSTTPEELAAIAALEQSLQRRLLTAFVTYAVELLFKNCIAGYTVDIVSRFQREQRNAPPRYYDFKVDIEVMTRLISLAESYDIDIQGTFQKYLDDSHKIFHSFNYKNSDDDDLSGQIFEKILIDFQENISNSLVTSSNNIVDSSLGILILYTHMVCSGEDGEGEHEQKSINILFNDILVATIRAVVPGMVQLSFINSGIHDILIYWGWYVIQNKPAGTLELEISNIPPILLKLYFQVMLFMCVTAEKASNLRYLMVTLLTKVLTLTPENIAYDFLRDSLENCPYDNLRVALGGVLKELLIKERPSEIQKADDELEKKLSSVKISNDELGSVSTTSAPPLPSRKFINLTKQRVEDIFNIIETNNTSTFTPSETGINVDISKLTTLSSTLNLLVVIKSNPLIDQKRLSTLLDLVLDSIEKVKKSDKEDSLKINAVEILSIAIDRIRK